MNGSLADLLPTLPITSEPYRFTSGGPCCRPSTAFRTAPTYDLVDRHGDRYRWDEASGWWWDYPGGVIEGMAGYTRAALDQSCGPLREVPRDDEDTRTARFGLPVGTGLDAPRDTVTSVIHAFAVDIAGKVEARLAAAPFPVRPVFEPATFTMSADGRSIVAEQAVRFEPVES